MIELNILFDKRKQTLRSVVPAGERLPVQVRPEVSDNRLMEQNRLR